MMENETTALVVREDELAAQTVIRVKAVYGVTITTEQAKAMYQAAQRAAEAMRLIMTDLETLSDALSEVFAKLGIVCRTTLESLADVLSSIYSAVEAEESKRTARLRKNDYRAVYGGYRARYAKCNPKYQTSVIHQTRFYRRPT